jgi:hypothetical protein
LTIDVGVTQLCHVLDVHFGPIWHHESRRRFPVQTYKESNISHHVELKMTETVQKADLPVPEEPMKYAVPFKSALFE